MQANGYHTVRGMGAGGTVTEVHRLPVEVMLKERCGGHWGMYNIHLHTERHAGRVLLSINFVLTISYMVTTAICIVKHANNSTLKSERINENILCLCTSSDITQVHVHFMIISTTIAKPCFFN